MSVFTLILTDTYAQTLSKCVRLAFVCLVLFVIEKGQNLKIIEKDLEVSYQVGKIHGTTKIIDLDPSYGQNLDEIAYFGSISLLNASSDPLLGELKIRRLLKMVKRCPI